MWFDHFLSHIKPTKHELLLILVGQLTNTKHLDVIERGRDSCVAIFRLTPHVTNRLRLLDYSLMFPLTQYYNNSLENDLITITSDL